jgi:hypothetical protein
VQCKEDISQGRREACGGGRQRPVPGRRPVSRVNRHLQMRLTPGHPESTHCQERFRNPPASHEVGAQDPRWTPPVQTRKIHQTPHQPKRPRMHDSAPRADTAPLGPPRAHATAHPLAATRPEHDDQRSPPTCGVRHSLQTPRESLRVPPPAHAA